MHFFGGLGTLTTFLGFMILLYLSIAKLFLRPPVLANRPLFFLGILLIIVGFQLFITGFIAELVTRNASDRNQYKIENKFEQIFSKKPFFLNAQNGHLINSANPIFFLIALLIFISGHSSAQIMGEAVHITTQNGLPNDICYDVNQDTRGYIWIGTEYGAARFNGRKFRSFSTHDGLSSNYIIGLTPYKDGVAMASWEEDLRPLPTMK